MKRKRLTQAGDQDYDNGYKVGADGVRKNITNMRWNGLVRDRDKSRASGQVRT